MLVDVTSMTASVPSSILGSGTVSTRTSRLPCQVTAFIAPLHAAPGPCAPRRATVDRHATTRDRRLKTRPRRRRQFPRDLHLHFAFRHRCPSREKVEPPRLSREFAAYRGCVGEESGVHTARW